jgi:hypothetical protein
MFPVNSVIRISSGEEKTRDRIRASFGVERLFRLSCSRVLREKKAASDPEK